MEFDIARIQQFLNEFQTLQISDKAALEERRAIPAERVDKSTASLHTEFLLNFLSAIIGGSITDTFRMAPLPNNCEKPKVEIMDLYTIVAPNPEYNQTLEQLRKTLQQLHYDLDLLHHERYHALVDSLLGNRQPLKELGDFCSLKEFLAREGCFWLQEKPGGFCIDLSDYAKYDVRTNFEPYGCKFDIDTDFNILEKDEKQLSLIRMTICLDIILHLHAMLCHLLVSQKLYLAATTTFYDKISKDTIMSEFYYLITYRANDINSKVPVLAGESGSLIQMGFGFKAESFKRLLQDILKDPRVQTASGLKEFLIDSRCGQWRQIAQPVYDVVDKFVERIVGNKIPDDFKARTKISLFVSTFFHEVVGDHQLKTIYTCELNTRTYRGKQFNRLTKEFAYIVAALTMGTALRILKIKDLVNGDYIGGEHLDAWKEFYQGLKAALKPYPWIDVDDFEFSVGY